MDRIVRIATRRSPPVGPLQLSLFGCVVGRALGFATAGSAGSVRLAADGSRGTHRGQRLRSFGSAVLPDLVLCSRPAQQCVQAEAASRLGLT